LRCVNDSSSFAFKSLASTRAQTYVMFYKNIVDNYNVSKVGIESTLGVSQLDDIHSPKKMRTNSDIIGTITSSSDSTNNDNDVILMKDDSTSLSNSNDIISSISSSSISGSGDSNSNFIINICINIIIIYCID